MANTAVIKETIRKRVREYMTRNAEDMAESHLDSWRERYAKYGGNENRVWEDIHINHDPSIEIESVETDLKTTLNSAEYDFVVSCFNNAVLRVWKRGDY